VPVTVCCPVPACEPSCAAVEPGCGCGN
jgi:hypothetical protein